MMKRTSVSLALLALLGGTLSGCYAANPIGPVDDDSTPVAESPTPTEKEVQGTRDNPFPVGYKVQVTEYDEPIWELTVTGPLVEQTSEIAKAEDFMFREPDAGTVYAMFPVTVTYIGEDHQNPFAMFSFDFVSADGRSFPSYASTLPDKKSLFDIGDLYTDATADAFEVVEAPEDLDGVIRVTAGGSYQFYIATK